jgi:hypothetical protein
VKKPSYLAVRQTIPFGEQTVGELEQLAKMEGVTPAEAEYYGNHPTNQKVNPKGLYDNWFTPIGDFTINAATFDDVAQAIVNANTLEKIVKKLEALKAAVKLEKGREVFHQRRFWVSIHQCLRQIY